MHVHVVPAVQHPVCMGVCVCMRVRVCMHACVCVHVWVRVSFIFLFCARFNVGYWTHRFSSCLLYTQLVACVGGLQLHLLHNFGVKPPMHRTRLHAQKIVVAAAVCQSCIYSWVITSHHAAVRHLFQGCEYLFKTICASLGTPGKLVWLP